MSIVQEIKKKREFSELPDSIVARVAKIFNGDVKESRALLRKYFGVFLTNRVLKGKEDLLKVHMSSKKRDYEKFYGEIFECVGAVESVVDLGCGVNGLSYEYLPKGVDYIGVEAVGQLVEIMNAYFKENDFSVRAVVGDLFDVDSVVRTLKKARAPRVVFLFQVIDALEGLERNFSKKFILEIANESEFVVLSLPMEILGGRRRFAVRRNWIVDFLEENFRVLKDFEVDGERIIVFRKDI